MGNNENIFRAVPIHVSNGQNANVSTQATANGRIRVFQQARLTVRISVIVKARFGHGEQLFRSW